MRKLFVLILILSSCYCSYSQRVDFKGIVFKDVVVDSNATAEQLYTRAKLFFANNYANAKATITFDDSNSKTVIGSGYIDVETWFGVEYCRIYHTVKIMCKDKRYMYDIYDKVVRINVPFSGTDHITNTPYEDYINEFKYSIGRRKITLDTFLNPMRNLEKSLKLSMTGTVDYDW